MEATVAAGDTTFDDWSKNIHVIITYLGPFWSGWQGYASLVSTLLGVGILIMENQVLLRMRMGRWEIVGYLLWCVISLALGPVFDIVVMGGLYLYCRKKSVSLNLTHESVAKSLLPAPVAQNYRLTGLACIAASTLTLTSNVLFMLNGWSEDEGDEALVANGFYAWSANVTRWAASQAWYAIAMIFLFHVVTRPAQSGVVFFGKLPRDIWSFKWLLCILYIPVHYSLLALCDRYQETKSILIPLEILVDVFLYNGPFLLVLMRLLYLGWKAAYEEALLTGAIHEDDEDDDYLGTPQMGPFSGLFWSAPQTSTSRNTGGAAVSGRYAGLAMVDLEDAEEGQSSRVAASGSNNTAPASPSSASTSPSGTAAAKKDQKDSAILMQSEEDEASPAPAYSLDYDALAFAAANRATSPGSIRSPHNPNASITPSPLRRTTTGSSLSSSQNGSPTTYSPSRSLSRSPNAQDSPQRSLLDDQDA